MPNDKTIVAPAHEDATSQATTTKYPIGSREWARRALESQARAAEDAREELLAKNRAARDQLANANLSPRGADALRAEMAVRAGRADAFALTARRLRDEANAIPKVLAWGEGLIA